MTWNPFGIFKRFCSCKHHQYSLWPGDNSKCYSAWFHPSVKLLKIAAGLRHERQGGVSEGEGTWITFSLKTVTHQNCILVFLQKGKMWHLQKVQTEVYKDQTSNLKAGFIPA